MIRLNDEWRIIGLNNDRTFNNPRFESIIVACSDDQRVDLAVLWERARVELERLRDED